MNLSNILLISSNQMINKKFKKKIFDRAAFTYDDYAVLQNKIIDNLFKRMDLITLNPEIAIDLGCGTGRVSKILHNKFTNLDLINFDLSEGMLSFAKNKNSNNLFPFLRKKKNSYICGDIDYLPFKNESFDLIWSSSAFQWSNNINSSFKQVLNILKPGGLFIFSTFGPNTLNELGKISEEIFDTSTINNFFDFNIIGDLLKNSGFKDSVLDVENYVLTYQNPKNLLIDLKKIGATAGEIDHNRGLVGKNFISKYLKSYEKFKENNLYPATYEVIYGYAWKN